MSGNARRRAVLALPYAWLLVFCVVPLLIVVEISLADSATGVSPYAPVIARDAEGWSVHASLANFQFLLSDSLFLRAYVNAIEFAAVATLICLLLGYPMAYGIARAPRRWRGLLLFLVILPLWSSFLIRVSAWIGLLKDDGLINNLLLALGIVDEPLALLNTAFAVCLGIVYSYLPFMVLPLYAALGQLDPTLLEAAADLGCRPARAFARVTLPLSLPAIAAGALLVFIPALGEFVVPDLLGGPDTSMIGKVLWDEFFTNRDWPAAAAVAVAMLVLLIVPMAFIRRLLQGQEA